MDTPSKHETVLSDKTQWISDKLFAQQRLAGTNPMSIKRVTTNGDGKNVFLVTNNSSSTSFAFKCGERTAEEEEKKEEKK